MIKLFDKTNKNGVDSKEFLEVCKAAVGTANEIILKFDE